MMEQGNLPTQRVNISTQKMLGGIGSILILLGLVTKIEILFILSIRRVRNSEKLEIP